MADSFSPPQPVRDNAKRGLELRDKYNRGGTEVGVARARDLSNGKSLPIDTIRRMVSYFARHEVDKKGEGWGKDSAGYIAWLLWGGDAGRAWATRINNEDNAKEKTMTQELAHSYAAITKSEKQADGTLKVYGKATDDSLDIDNQICDEGWLAQAMPDWFTTGGNVREQHSNIAAGVATDYEKKADGHYITALVVDPVSVKKVETGVLKGFSIGIRSPRVVRDNKAANGRIIDGQIVEVSLVDRPANPNAKLMLAKAAEGGTLMAVEQNSPSPADVARFITKSNPIEDIVEAVEAKVDEIVTDVEALAPAVEELVADAEAIIDEVVKDVEDIITPEAEIVNASKSLLATLNKFDQATYDNAVAALSDLIVVEAGEMKEGHDERDSIKELLRAVKHLFHWYQGEVNEGEVADVNPNIADDDDVPAEEIFMAADGEDKPAFGEKPAGDKPALGDDEKCDKCGEIGKACKCAKADDAMKAAGSTLATVNFDDDQLAGIVEKAVSSAKESVANEIEALKAAAQAAEQKAEQFEADLAVALTKAVSGGPKRASLTKKSASIDDLLVKAAEYTKKADATIDTVLAKGYRDLAADLTKKAAKAGKQ